MFRNLFLLIFIMFANDAIAQISDLVFLGTVTVKDGSTYTYKLQMTDSNGILKGYSVTDVRGANETETAVLGKINVAEKQLDFRETKIIYTKSNVQRSNFCYINAHLKVANTHGATMLSGHFKGYKEDGKTRCASGNLTLISAQDILNKLLEIANKDSITAEKSETNNKPEYANDEGKAVPESSVKKVMPGNEVNLACSASSITIEIWDAKNIDGDIITMMQDENKILENYTLSGNHKRVSINMGDKRTSVITIIAISEGSEPLNTARVKVVSGNNVYEIDATTVIGRNVTLNLKHE